MQSQQALIHPPDTCQKAQAFPKKWGLLKIPLPPSGLCLNSLLCRFEGFWVIG